ncbi:MAG: SDR family oxidoreductase [Planctomycetota bacterium]
MPEHSAQRLAGKVAVVTGGGWNVGRAVALRFAREGASVAVAGRNAERLDETVALIEEATGGAAKALAVPCDVTEREQVDALVDRTRAELGSAHVLAAIAGGGGGYDQVDEIDPEWWAYVIRLNLVGTFHAVRAVVPDMRRMGGGSILTCTGGGGFFPALGTPASAYATSKAGICRLTDQLALELHGAGIRVNCVSPELVWSPERLAEVEAEERRTGTKHPDRDNVHPPEDAAELAAWLASDESAPLTGRAVSVNDRWWRDRAEVERVIASVHAYTLRRVDADARVPQ